MANFNTEIVNFAAGDTTFYEAWRDYYFDSNRDRKLGVFDEKLSITEKGEKLNSAFFAEVSRQSGVQRDSMKVESWASHPSVQWASFAVIDAAINSVLPQTINPNMGRFTDIKYAGFGDIIKFKVRPRTLYTMSKGGHGERATFRQKKFNGDIIISPVEHIITVYVDMYAVLAGKEDIGEFMRLAVISVEREMGLDAMSALTAGLSAATYPSTLRQTGVFSSSTLITLGETVAAYNYGARPVFMGTAGTLAKVVPDSAMGYRGNFDANGGSVNLIENFYGFDLIVLDQYAAGTNPTDGLALADNVLYAVSPAMDKLVKGVISNTLTNSNQFYDNADITQNFTMRKNWAFEFASAAWGGIYTITD